MKNLVVILIACGMWNVAQAAPQGATTGTSSLNAPSTGAIELEPNLGMSLMSPGDLNGVIRDNNDAIQKQGVKSFSVGDLGSSIGFGLAATYRVIPKLGLGLGFNRLSASTDGSAKVGENSLTGKYSMGASLLTAEARIIPLATNDGKLEAVVAPFVGIGFYSASTELGGSALQGGTREVASSATGPVFGASIGGRYWFTPFVSLGVQGGYRYAKSSVLKVDSQKNTEVAVGSQVESDGKKISADASSITLGTQLVVAIQ